jgi:hypothetical protein
MSRTSSLSMTGLLVALVLLAVVPAAAAIRVPTDVSTIGGALQAATPGDTILVAPGSYQVNLEWPSTPGIKLIGEAGALATILDGRDIVQVIGIYTGVDTTTVVRGFRIQNGHAEGQ